MPGVPVEFIGEGVRTRSHRSLFGDVEGVVCAVGACDVHYGRPQGAGQGIIRPKVESATYRIQKLLFKETK